MSSALALVNTRMLRGSEPVDVIVDPAAAARWLAARGLIPASCPVTETEAAALRALRESIRGLFSARAAARLPAADDVGVLNATLAAAPPTPALAWGESGPRAEPVYTRGDIVSIALSRLAADALGLLTASGAEPAPCGAHGCIRWFLRTHAARQWCSTRCSDRVRAARHYARHHPAS